MRELVISFDDAEFAKLKLAKGSMTWRKFLLTIAQEKMAETLTQVPSQIPAKAKISHA
jgi:hypothetical protein